MSYTNDDARFDAEQQGRCGVCGREVAECRHCKHCGGKHEPQTYQGLAYVNAYAVTRHYGGPEEGGWWYNRGTPLASVPIPCTFTVTHDCDGDGEEGWCSGCYHNGERRAMCENTKWEPNANAREHMVAYLEAAFADVKDGNIYSVRGGTDVQISVETEMAYEWPRERPHYE